MHGVCMLVPSPPRTMDCGPLMAAIETSCAARPARATAARTVGASALTETIEPASGVSSIARPRSHTSAIAVGRSSTPATTAATYSPTEWPTTAYGSHPSHMATRPYSTANSAGIVNVGVCKRAAHSASASAGG